MNSIRMPTLQEVMALAEAGGHRNDAEMASALNALYLNPGEKRAPVVERLVRYFSLQARLQGREVHPFLPSPPREVIQSGNMLAGFLPFYHEPVTLPFAGHKYVCGKTGSGKTTFVELLLMAIDGAGKDIIVFDPEGQFPVEIGAFVPRKDVYLVDAQNYCINPWRPPAGCPVEKWIGILGNIEREVWFYRRGSELLSDEVKLNIVRSGRPLTVNSYAEEVDRRKPGGRSFREFQSWESVKSTTQGMMMFLPQLTVEQSAGLDEIFSRRVVIFDWSSVENTQFRNFLTLHAMAWLTFSRPYEQERGVDTFIVCDEVSTLASIDLQNMNDIGEPFFLTVMRRSKKRGYSIITLDQTPSRTHPVVRANSDTKVILGEIVEGRDRKVVANDLGLDEDQREYLSRLQPRQAIVKMPNVLPFLMEVPDVRRV